MLLVRIVLGLAVFAVALVFSSSAAYAHTVYHLEGRRFVVVCDNGYAFDFGGSEGGAYEVADIICPNPPVPPLASVGPRTTRSLPRASDFVSVNRAGRYLLRPEVAASLNGAGFRGYPPHGYPCLGCEPCPGNPTQFCDIVGIRLDPGAAAAGWVLTRAGRLARVSRRETETNRAADPRPQ